MRVASLALLLFDDHGVGWGHFDDGDQLIYNWFVVRLVLNDVVLHQDSVVLGEDAGPHLGAGAVVAGHLGQGEPHLRVGLVVVEDGHVTSVWHFQEISHAG